VLEWCEDWYDENYDVTAVVDPQGPATGMNKVLRGGYWSGPARLCRSAYRVEAPPGTKLEHIGFRVVVAVEESDKDRQPEVDAPAITPGDGLAVSPNQPREVLVELGDNLYMRLAPVKAGTFMMGSPRSEVDRQDDETQHEVTISKPFLIGVCAVTQEQYAFLMGKNPSEFRRDVQNPVENVTWDEAAEFCRVMSEKTGKKVKLPTEAQWEYACRAGTVTPFHTGETIATGLANYDGRYVYGNGERGENRKMTTPTAAFLPNDFGLYDMHGNVQEWCSDWYDRNTYTSAARKDPTGPAEGSFRVVRGGSWFHGPLNSRAAIRDCSAPSSRSNYIGFRVVVELE
jgi:formylglycine-generating enzyme required for sulfatase activity